MPGKPLVFISCGQQVEKALGEKVAKLVEKLTGADAYFAENQHDLEALSSHIFDALNRAVGFVAIMHHRGKVETPHKKFVRASVWIEQEIAIMAFLKHAHNKRLKIAAFVQKDIHREGVRELLMLNPVSFESDQDVLDALKDILPKWKDQFDESGTLDCEVRMSRIDAGIGADRHTYALKIIVKNNSKRDIKHWRADVHLPKLVEPTCSLSPAEDSSKLSNSHILFRLTPESTRQCGRSGVIHRGSEDQLLPAVHYVVDTKIHRKLHEMPKGSSPPIQVSFFAEEGEPIVVAKPVEELINF